LPTRNLKDAAAPLTLPAALALAEGGNATLSAARHELAARAAPCSRRALPNPELQTVLEDTRRATRSTTVQLNQLIELGGKRGARRRRPARRRRGTGWPFLQQAETRAASSALSTCWRRRACAWPTARKPWPRAPATSRRAGVTAGKASPSRKPAPGSPKRASSWN
jgi:cobalt-zinc-cadmium efflux system outer membrane protein